MLYTIDVKEVAWHSVYEVGHRLVDLFHDHDESSRLPHRRCLPYPLREGGSGHECLDDSGFNIAWKLGHVLDGRAPGDLLCTYHGERQPAAQNLINFDREWSTLMATPVEELEDPEAVEKYYVAAEEFAAGMLTEYASNAIVGDTTYQDLATGFPVGKRFKSFVAKRRADARRAPRPPTFCRWPLPHLCFRRPDGTKRRQSELAGGEVG